MESYSAHVEVQMKTTYDAWIYVDDEWCFSKEEEDLAVARFKSYYSGDKGYTYRIKTIREISATKTEEI